MVTWRPGIIGTGTIIIVMGLAVFLPHLRGAWVAWRSPVSDIGAIVQPATIAVGSSSQTPTSSSSTTVTGVKGLVVAPGFELSLLAKNIPGARVIAQDELGHLWISQTKPGTITRLEMNNEVAQGQEIVLSGLNKPHGLAFDPADPTALYIATEKELLRYRIYTPDARPEKIIDLPSGGLHTTRSLLFRSDGWLYVSIGSTCNACRERDPRLAAISRINVHAADPQLSVYATGLRNAVFMTENPLTRELIVTEMGRDYLGDTAPPDEINSVFEGKNYGWPLCYGKNIHDTVFDDQAVNPCREPFALPSFIDLPAHSAPLGLAFIPAAWNEAWRGNLLVAEHGSWNSTKPVGYKIVRLIIDERGRYYGSEDVVSGWLTERETLGRPVDVVVDQSGSQLYISDDKAGAIYVLRPAAS